MLANCPILIVEDDPYVALDLSSMIEELDGRVVGPTREIAEALELLRSQSIQAAIVDWQLSGCTASPITSRLSERRVPFVIHATQHLRPPELARHPTVPVLIKPMQPRTVLARLVVEMRKMARQPAVMPNLNEIR